MSGFVPLASMVRQENEKTRFIKVVHNGIAVQENVDLEGGTRSHMEIPEAATNPLMLQGDHGPVSISQYYSPASAMSEWIDISVPVRYRHGALARRYFCEHSANERHASRAMSRTCGRSL